MGEVGIGHDAAYVAEFSFRREVMEIHSAVDGPAQTLGVVVLEKETVAAIGLGIELKDGVPKSTGSVDNGQTTVAHPYHLGETAGFEGRGHEDKIGRGVGEAGKRVVEFPNSDTALKPVRFYNVLKVGDERAISHEDHLQAAFLIVCGDLLEDFRENLAAFLDGIEAGRPEEKRGR